MSCVVNVLHDKARGYWGTPNLSLSEKVLFGVYFYSFPVWNK
ncbi:hypothetical protein [Caudoviricetes sp.]|nr:hypothetical protein [Caudoviricetes sp.]